MAAWGFTGMFKGAVVLALMYTIFRTWVYGKQANAEKATEKPLMTESV
jgi:predicted PurR-regulated permease PerM